MGYKNHSFPLLNTAVVKNDEFKVWAKKAGHTIGSITSKYYCIDVELVNLLYKLSDMRKISSDLEEILN
jgi:hypothetical protein